MNYKLKGAIRRSRKSFIICAILWIFLTIVFVVPLSNSIFSANTAEGFQLNIFIQQFVNSMSNPFSAMGNLFSNGGTHTFFSTFFGFTIFYLVFFFIGFVKTAPKNEFTDIEHGSSDWSQHGEQYQILSKNKGIILAEDNYLPVDKRGNVNVLVVGRFRFR